MRLIQESKKEYQALQSHAGALYKAAIERTKAVDAESAEDEDA